MPINERFLTSLKAEIKARNMSWTPVKTTAKQFKMTDLQRRRLLGCLMKSTDPTPDQLEAISKRNIDVHVRALTGRPRIAAIQSAGLPGHWDWRSVDGRNFIDPIQDQGQCGSCVAFAVVGALESNARIDRDVAFSDGNFKVDMSEAQLFFCGAGQKCDTGWYIQDALKYTKKTGVACEKSFRYTDTNQACQLGSGWQDEITQVLQYHEIKAVRDMKTWLTERGPLVTRFNVYDDFYLYDSGVYRHVSGDRVGGHAVLCIGYDDTLRAWLCKNSWGTWFGESGYFWIGYGECGINASMYAIDSFKKIFGIPVRPFMEWWEEKDFKGRRHVRYLADIPKGPCNKLVHNDKMKSLKFHGLPGWKLEIYDSATCSRNDDWARVTFPDDPNVKVVSVPKIGWRGENEVKPAGCYKLSRKNGIVGKVSAIKVSKVEKTGKLIWWEDKDYKGRRHTRILYPSEHKKALKLVNNDKMKSLKFYGFPDWTLQLYDKSDCSKTGAWGELHFPNDPSVTVVSLPKIGKRGESEVVPSGMYKLHKKPLPGRVSAIKHFGT